MHQHIKDLIDFDIRHQMFYRAIRFIDYELVEGDILEFGVYTGRSLALLSHYHEDFKKTIHGHKTPKRNIIGLDSFKGLAKNEHERWEEGTFRINQSYHPTIAKGEEVTPERVSAFFFQCGLDVTIVDGYYSEIETEFLQVCDKVALIHIDCDLYESTKEALNLVKDKIQNGCIILFDDWFNFKGATNKGEQLAFTEFLKENQNIQSVEYHPYATFGKSFILTVK